jgi:hypothetical protein
VFALQNDLAAGKPCPDGPLDHALVSSYVQAQIMHQMTIEFSTKIQNLIPLNSIVDMMTYLRPHIILIVKFQHQPIVSNWKSFVK